MEFICNDQDSKWYYDGRYYVRLYTDNSFKRISPQNIPDPEALLESRLKNAIRQGNTPDIDLMRPTKAVYSLYKHRMENNL